MQSREINSIDQMMDGAITERFQLMMAQIWRNVYDPNTDPEKTRSVTLTFKFKPNKLRDAVIMTTDVKNSLAPLMPLAQTVLIEQHDDGSVTAIERTGQIKGQLDMEGNETLPNVIKFNA